RVPFARHPAVGPGGRVGPPHLLHRRGIERRGGLAVARMVALRRCRGSGTEHQGHREQQAKTQQAGIQAHDIDPLVRDWRIPCSIFAQRFATDAPVCQDGMGRWKTARGDAAPRAVVRGGTPRAQRTRTSGRPDVRLILALSLILSSAALAAQPAHAQSACDRECLRGKVTEVLHALVHDDVGKLAVAGNLRVTEDGVERTLDQVGLVRTVTKLRGYRQDVIDERAGVAVTGAMVEESGSPVLLAVRVKVDGEAKISELELVATRGRADGLLYNVDGFGNAASLAMNLPPRPDQLESREEAIRIAMHYPRGLSNAETFNAVGTP